MNVLRCARKEWLNRTDRFHVAGTDEDELSREVSLGCIIELNWGTSAGRRHGGRWGKNSKQPGFVGRLLGFNLVVLLFPLCSKLVDPLPSAAPVAARGPESAIKGEEGQSGK
uniref:Uncharacterized protein n=1 Tax=Chromera velia CCMP2878 TaxID=1169474 RepID=A0A0G4GFR0_9ALVE|eukprot:Cvel_21690.t1-p1 / transcript=Cvel_21690.t1 / gene=Cvel_21690 / organism=Chromera_velia_CCMP2878 / gene_product=hypothetical protein / transcript_product=hypothetical protein / location=Cvel_scaffold2056:5825-8032(+) / protein_length=111 / sequence_SO=supercontig / SO=protein_coding / is_pseudo=false